MLMGSYPLNRGLRPVRRPRGPVYRRRRPSPMSDADTASVSTLEGGLGAPAQQIQPTPQYVEIRAGGYVNFYPTAEEPARLALVAEERRRR